MREPAMPASPLLQEVYAETVRLEGEPDGSISFEDGPAGAPSRIDVMVWLPEDDDGVTLLQTVGMSDLPMEGNARAELRWAIRGSLSEEDAGDCCRFLANLAVHPFQAKTFFDWFHRVRSVPPLFPGCVGCWLHPKFVESGVDEIETQGEKVRLLYVVPLTEEEYGTPDGKLLELWAERNVDLFTPR